MSEQIDTWGGSTPAKDTEPLFVTRRPRWQAAILLVPGWAIIAVAVVVALSDATSGDADALTSAVISLVVFGAAGGLLLLFGALVNGSQVRGHGDRLEVRTGLGRFRQVAPKDLVRLRHGSQRTNGGVTFISLTGWDARRKKQFMVFTGYRGYAELADWLAANRPEQWAECVAVGVED